jgi:hypothetical protein
MREWNTAFELYVIAPWGRCTSEAVIYSAAGQAAEGFCCNKAVRYDVRNKMND